MAIICALSSRIHFSYGIRGSVLQTGFKKSPVFPIRVIPASGLAVFQMTKKVFIKTFGCQMNEYDSDKMVDVLHAADGYEKTAVMEEADLILFNTCSVREKAQEKVFSDLGRARQLRKKGAQIGVGGCVASQEGAAIISRAPFVDLVFGPQTLHRLPEICLLYTSPSPRDS